jgi:hypothetical protein
VRFHLSLCAIRLSEVNTELASENKQDSVIIPRNPQSSKDIAKARFNSKSSTFEATNSRQFSEVKTNADMELAVQVHVEQSVSVDYESEGHDRDHRKLAWEDQS